MTGPEDDEKPSNPEPRKDGALSEESGGPAGAAGPIHLERMEALLTAEYDRRKALEGRGSTLVTSSTTMLTLIFGLTVIVTGKDKPFTDHRAVWLLIGALAAFVLSAVIAIFVQVYGTVWTRIETLERLVGSDWNVTENDARRMWACHQVQTIKTLRAGNSRRAKYVLGSFGIQVLAITMLAISVAIELLRWL
jgi:hypothetical protein